MQTIKKLTIVVILGTPVQCVSESFGQSEGARMDCSIPGGSKKLPVFKSSAKPFYDV